MVEMAVLSALSIGKLQTIHCGGGSSHSLALLAVKDDLIIGDDN